MRAEIISKGHQAPASAIYYEVLELYERYVVGGNVNIFSKSFQDVKYPLEATRVLHLSDEDTINRIKTVEMKDINFWSVTRT
jgi:hypothetical protein